MTDYQNEEVAALKMAAKAKKEKVEAAEVELAAAKAKKEAAEEALVELAAAKAKKEAALASAKAKKEALKDIQEKYDERSKKQELKDIIVAGFRGNLTPNVVATKILAHECAKDQDKLISTLQAMVNYQELLHNSSSATLNTGIRDFLYQVIDRVMERLVPILQTKASKVRIQIRQIKSDAKSWVDKEKEKADKTAGLEINK